MRAACALALLIGCTDEVVPSDRPRDLFEEVWAASIRSGDLVVVVPGTGSFTTLGLYIEDEQGAFDGRTYLINVDPIEGAIAAAQRAGFTAAQLEAGEITFALWGAGITKLERFDYTSVGGLHLSLDVIGGLSACGTGGIADNLTNYNGGNAERDARDLYRRLQTYLASGSPDRNVTLVAHSWGGVVAQYFATFQATLLQEEGALGGNPAFVVSGGVPGLVPGFETHGPGFRTVDSEDEDVTAAVKSYEVDRPDDPVHTFDPNETGQGHHYIIMFDDAYQGWYGVTTDELSCATVPGRCPKRM